MSYIWYPYTQMKDLAENPPIFIKKAQGIILYDNKGNEYYDTISSWWCNILGHGRKDINEIIAKQHKELDHIIFAGFTHEPAIRLAENVIKTLPGHFSKVFYSDNGSTACEVALKMSIGYWKNKGKRKKNKIIHLKYSYHGDTVGAMSIGGIPLFCNKFSDLFFETYEIETPYCYRCPYNKNYPECDFDCLNNLNILLRKKSEEIAALIIEPLVLAAGGMIIYPAEYLNRLDTILKAHDVHLIFDEVATGFGRTGKLFALEYTKAKPDFICLSKGITGGTLPLAITATTQEIYEAFLGDHTKTFYHGHTYTANPIACAIANKVIEIIKTEKIIENIQKDIIPYLHEKVNIMKEIEIVGDIRKLGMIIAFELVKDRKSKIPIEKEIFKKIYRKGLGKKLILRPIGNCIYYYLPLVIKKEDIDYIVENTYEILKGI